MSKTHQEHQGIGFLEDQRDFFDKLITQDWDTYINRHWDRTRQVEVREILRRIPPPRRVLDVGCGAGYHDLVFAKSPRVEQIIGVDYSSKSIEQANRHYPHPKVERAVASIFEPGTIRQRWGQFDLVTSFQVIEHLKDSRQFLEACCHCTNPGGYIAVVTPNRLRVENRVRRFLGYPPRLIDPMHFTEYSIADLTDLGKILGLQMVGTFGHTVHLAASPSLTLLNGTSPIGLWIGRALPGVANVVGIIFQRAD
jgi:2-polyprenyl-3-methyl-5-hydroxy-6-metoxy-1,4-benzoquinol methylase